MAIWNILRRFGKFYDHLVHFVLIWYIFPVLVSRVKKNLATLISDLNMKENSSEKEEKTSAEIVKPNLKC
jgi:hypothetical protein